MKTPNLVIKYRFEGNANDESGNGLDGTITDATLVTGKMGQAYSFNASTSKIKTVSHNKFTGISALTICAWIKTGSTGINTIFSHIADAPPYDGFTCNIGRNTAGKLEYYNSEVGAWRSSTSSNYNSDEWVHIAIVDDGSNIYLYKNAVPDGVLASSSLNIADQISRVGKERVPAPRIFDGEIDEVNVFKSALSVGDIKRVMMGLHPLKG